MATVDPPSSSSASAASATTLTALAQARRGIPSFPGPQELCGVPASTIIHQLYAPHVASAVAASTAARKRDQAWLCLDRLRRRSGQLSRALAQARHVAPPREPWRNYDGDDAEPMVSDYGEDVIPNAANRAALRALRLHVLRESAAIDAWAVRILHWLSQACRNLRADWPDAWLSVACRYARSPAHQDASASAGAACGAGAATGATATTAAAAESPHDGYEDDVERVRREWECLQECWDKLISIVSLEADRIKWATKLVMVERSDLIACHAAFAGSGQPSVEPLLPRLCRKAPGADRFGSVLSWLRRNALWLGLAALGAAAVAGGAYYLVKVRPLLQTGAELKEVYTKLADHEVRVKAQQSAALEAIHTATTADPKADAGADDMSWVLSNIWSAYSRADTVMESHTETKAAKQRWEAAEEVASSQWWGAGLASAASALVTTVAAAASSLLSPSLQPWLVSKHWAYISTAAPDVKELSDQAPAAAALDLHAVLHTVVAKQEVYKRFMTTIATPQDCLVCESPMRPSDVVVASSNATCAVKHRLHRKCRLTWMASHEDSAYNNYWERHCPICRQVVPEWSAVIPATPFCRGTGYSLHIP